jgi:hypothetical protein
VAGEPFQVLVTSRKCGSSKAGTHHTLFKEDYFVTGKILTLEIDPFEIFWNAKDLYVRVHYIPAMACQNL